MTNITAERIGDYIVKVVVDEDPVNPRDDCNLGKMFCAHRRYALGDGTFDKADHNGRVHTSWSEVRDFLMREFDTAVILPLYLYDHSGITISTAPFHCPWDSGQVGFILATKEEVREEFGVKRISAKLREKVADILRYEVSAYDSYIGGSYCGYAIYKVSVCDHGEEHTEFIDSCFGYDDSDIALEDGKAEVARLTETA